MVRSKREEESILENTYSNENLNDLALVMESMAPPTLPDTTNESQHVASFASPLTPSGLSVAAQSLACPDNSIAKLGMITIMTYLLNALIGQSLNFFFKSFLGMETLLIGYNRGCRSQNCLKKK